MHYENFEYPQAKRLHKAFNEPFIKKLPKRSQEPGNPTETKEADDDDNIDD